MAGGVATTLRAALAFLLALLLVLPAPPLAAAAAAGGGAAAAAAGGAAVAGGGGAGDPPPPGGHAMGDALASHLLAARADHAAHLVGPHPLGAGEYTAPPAAGGGAAQGAPRGAGGRPAWTAHESWKTLQADKPALNAYLAQRAAVLKNPRLDWGPVLAVLRPLLAEEREYIGIANLGEDGVTVSLTAFEAAPGPSARQRRVYFASIPAALVAKYADRPALFIFHTHPDHPNSNPLPSTPDLVTAVTLGALTQFAASAVVSSYGVLLHGLSWQAYAEINSAADPGQARLNFVHDVVAAHEAVRSWAPHTLADYAAFYPRHQLFFVAFPSPAMVGASLGLIEGDLERHIDYELLGAAGADARRRPRRAEGKGLALRRPASSSGMKKGLAWGPGAAAPPLMALDEVKSRAGHAVVRPERQAAHPVLQWLSRGAPPLSYDE